MKDKLLISFFFFTVLAAYVAGQQPAQFSQYMLNKYQLNPAYAGMDFSLSITALNRNQWSGFSGRPVTQNVNAHLPFYLWNGALGINLENEKLGAQAYTSIGMSFNYVIDSPFGLFSTGLRIGLKQLRINGKDLRSPDGLYEGNIIEHNDPILPGTDVSGITPVWELGFYYIYDYIEGGISIANFPSNLVSLGSFDVENKNWIKAYLEYEYVYNDDFKVSPSILYKTDFVQSQTDVSAMIYYRNKYFGGIGLRGYSGKTLDAVIFIAGLQFNRNYRFSYSYDFGISNLNSFHEGTHEFVLNYNLRKLIGAGLPPKIIYNPRFL